MSVLGKAAAAEEGEKVSYDEEIAIYSNALSAQQKELAKTMKAETEAMIKLADLLK